jgi:CRISPR-associated endoribonuclease Cas6
MRIHFKITKNTKSVPFNYLQNLVGAFHKWLGWNDIHNETSLYSISWLQGGQLKNKALNFPYGATWFISFFDNALAKDCLKGILNDPTIAFGMEVKDVLLQETPNFSEIKKFNVASPVLLRKKEEQHKSKFYYYSDGIISDELLTNILQTKLQKAGIDNSGVKVYFDKSYSNPKIKLVSYKDIENKGSICPIIIEGTPEQVAFAWNVGVGHSTGIGFGSLV